MGGRVVSVASQFHHRPLTRSRTHPRPGPLHFMGPAILSSAHSTSAAPASSARCARHRRGPASFATGAPSVPIALPGRRDRVLILAFAAALVSACGDGGRSPAAPGSRRWRARICRRPRLGDSRRLIPSDAHEAGAEQLASSPVMTSADDMESTGSYGRRRRSSCARLPLLPDRPQLLRRRVRFYYIALHGFRRWRGARSP